MAESTSSSRSVGGLALGILDLQGAVDIARLPEGRAICYSEHLFSGASLASGIT